MTEAVSAAAHAVASPAAASGLGTPDWGTAHARKPAGAAIIGARALAGRRHAASRAMGSFKLGLIDGGYHVLQFVLYGLILGLWH